MAIGTASDNQATPKAKKLRAVLGYLCVSKGQTVHAGRLIEALWPGEPPRTASTALHVYVSKLRKHLASIGLDGTSLIVTQPPGYRLNLCGYSLDLAEFEGMVTKSREAHALGDAVEAAEHLADAISLWRGRALDDLRELPIFETLGRRLDERRAHACEQRIELELEIGNHKTIIEEIHSLIDEYSTRESLYGYLMVALYRSGRAADALAAYDHIRSLLMDDLGVEPTPQLRSLQHAVLAHAPSLERAAPCIIMRGGGITPMREYPAGASARF
ncbi:AfsR/SARP family transcriptional regulator [Streptomyces sp. JH14]|uniref:AfsR/SARP family transcriptional regulator n=1 Tax=Streptomyces sp. JH14 TaxID=2793630 RepID=UPI0023F81603|nr:AfsR/SARP family transcriptional regulator [Streptomyces sp. JH14]MDF6043833.1 AfsR/SARP family transcriptional regulator [Streptomyces sp. JH14]